MQIVGVDFGTSNVRIATWDSESQPSPVSVHIGPDDASTMPAVIAFRRDAPTVVGQAADGLTDAADTVVVRNIKRWALSGDPYVDLHLDLLAKQSPAPGWWDPETRRVATPWGESFPVWEVIRQIMQEAFRRAGPRLAELGGGFQWRAGCPVDAGLEYRSELAGVMSEFGGENRITSVVEEPVLFLVMAHQLGKLRAGGSYLVYDLGGGSFDSALAELSEDGRDITVYASHSNPVLGGTAIDKLLEKRLGYAGRADLLRIAKEQLHPGNDPEVAVDLDTVLSWDDLTDALQKDLFLEKTHTVMREVYISAKTVWKYDANAPTLGYSALPSCPLGQLPAAFAKDLNAVILCGGPSKSPYIRARMKEFFGDTLVVTAEELIPSEIPEPELTGLSIGACYAAEENYNPTYIRRLPARISLTDTATGTRQEYQPYRHFSARKAFDPEFPFISPPLTLPPEADPNGRYELVVASPEGEIHTHQTVAFRSGIAAGSPRNEARLVRLVVDRFGRIGIQVAGREQSATEVKETAVRWQVESDELPWRIRQPAPPREYDARTWGTESETGLATISWQEATRLGIT